MPPNAPEALVRIGVLSFAEVRLGAPNYVRVHRAGGDFLADGTDDPTVGIKLELPRLAGIDLAFLPSTTIPIEDDTPGQVNAVRERFGANRLQPSFLLLANTDLTPRLSLGTQGGITYLQPGLTGAELQGSLVLGFALDEQVGLFAEVGATDLVKQDRMAEVLLHGGATLLLTNDLQLDAHVGAGITDAAPDLRVGIGASARF